jgi:predicted nucleic acid-binding protein
VLYLDASAIVKLVAPEPESAALVAILRSRPEVVSSAVSLTEVVRAVRRAAAGRHRLRRAEAVCSRIALVPLDQGILRRAAHLDPVALRTLDAIHLATALVLAPDLEGFVTYDVRLAAAAEASGLTVLSPS